MKDKERVIIETAIKLFAQKGFTNTSIQEIAVESGISKGAFYLHFKSKDSLLLSVLEYYYDIIQHNLHKFDDLKLPPREIFTCQLESLLNIFIQEKEFIIMQTREQAIPLNESVKVFLLKMHKESHEFYQGAIKAIYGDTIKDYLWDLSILLDGLLQSYIRLILLDPTEFNTEKVVKFIMNRLDNIVGGIINDEPLITESKLTSLMLKTKTFFINDDHKIETVLKHLRQQIEALDEHEDLLISLEVLETEINKDSPRIPVIQGMLSNFKDFPTLDRYRKDIASFYQLKI